MAIVNHRPMESNAPLFPVPLKGRIMRRYPELRLWEKKNKELLVTIQKALHIIPPPELMNINQDIEQEQKNWTL